MRLDRKDTVQGEPPSVRAELLSVRAEPTTVRAEPVEALVALRRKPFDKLRANGIDPFGLSLSKPRRGSPTALRQAQGERWLPQSERCFPQSERRWFANASALLIAGLMLATPLRAQDRADIDRTQIIGNRELPKVLYIVPWKKPMPGDLSAKPMGSVLDEALAPVDRDVFRRQVQYDAQTQTPQAKPVAAAPAARP